MRIESDLKLDFQDVLLKPKRSTIESRKEINLERAFHFRHSTMPWMGVPIISSNMSSVTTLVVANKMVEHKMLACLPKNLKIDSISSQTNLIPSMGLEDSGDFEYGFLCVDVPNGYMQKVIDFTKELRDWYQERVTLIVGNVVTAEQTEALILAGADIVKVGIGSGAACSTRIKTGVGMPQLSAIIECSDAAHGLGGHIVSDGGCVVSGDICKAFAAGADFVMLGGMLAGHNENGTDFYGSSSERGNNETAGGLRSYRASEGWELQLPSRGTIEGTLQDIEGGLRSACSYIGAKSIKHLPKCSTFVQVGRQANMSMWEHRV